MVKKSKRYALTAGVIMVTIAIVVVYRIWNKPHQDVKEADAVSISAIALYNSLSGNDAESKRLYLNKVVEVSGQVTKVSENQQSQQVIFLKTDVPGGAVNCTMEEKAPNLRPGDPILIKGICSGYISGDADMGLPGDVFIIRCYRSFKN